LRSNRGYLACAISTLALGFSALAGADEGSIAASPPGPALPAAEVQTLAAATAPTVAEPDPLFDDDFDDSFGESPEVYDPFESGNRVMLTFNQGVDRVLWSPLTKGYRLAVPEPGRRALRRVLDNLNTPIYMVNHLLQLRPGAAAETFGAFVVNTTFGIGGLLDAGEAAGFERVPADFGQTLARAGVGAGPYIVVPILGPSTFRDGFGWVVDRAFHPATYFLGIPIQLMWRGGAGMAEREAVADAMEALEESSLDYYSVLRSAYVQAREREIEPPELDPNVSSL